MIQIRHSFLLPDLEHAEFDRSNMRKLTVTAPKANNLTSSRTISLAPVNISQNDDVGEAQSPRHYATQENPLTAENLYELVLQIAFAQPILATISELKHIELLRHHKVLNARFISDKVLILAHSHQQLDQSGLVIPSFFDSVQAANPSP